MTIEKKKRLTDFLQTKYPTILPRKIVTECLRAITYAERCMEVCWWMCVLKPLIAMVWIPDKSSGSVLRTL
ncbi:hypothetical protein CHS0354_006603 [Potamilus streckersoni]|uniref:Uncharacterized protein n=1 Tax=Potamilus streckersoni TaxID=2493646 RepID=A0AAE0SWE5_9BIVA|nr:hypothetical protein CHS0354_006603 [Potamilus streckersoni]